MQLKYKVIIAVVALAGAFAFGRYSAPESIKKSTETNQGEDKKSTTDKETDKHEHKKTTTREITKPDGTKETDTTTETDTDVNRTTKNTTSDVSSSASKTTEEITRGHSRLTISALGATRVNNLSGPFTPAYGGMIQRDMIGPVNMGAFGLSDGTCGVAVGLSF